MHGIHYWVMLEASVGLYLTIHRKSPAHQNHLFSSYIHLLSKNTMEHRLSPLLCVPRMLLGHKGDIRCTDQ